MEKEGTETLMGRIEKHGDKFPWYLEKTSFLPTIGAAILVGQWMWLESGWSEELLWPATVCGLPLMAIITAEIISRVIQRFHISQSN